MASLIEKRWKLRSERFNTSVFGVSKTGDLTVSLGKQIYNVPLLAREYGTPLEIFLPEVLTSRVETIFHSFQQSIKKSKYDGRFFYHYPMKVNQRKEFVLAALAGGAQIETSSANELSLVRQLIENGQTKRSLHIHCNGPKTKEYLDLILSMHQGGFYVVPIIEDEHELSLLRNYPGKVGIRVDLDIKIKSHWDKKFNRFGFKEADLRALGMIPNLSILSYHLSSQVENMESFTKPLRPAMKLYSDLKKLNPSLSTLNIGGGAGIPYIKERFYTTNELASAIVSTCKKEAARLRVSPPHIMCEWGRHVAAPAQITIFKVIGEKSVAKNLTTKWYIIDGSFIANLPDTWSLHQRWHVIPANRMGGGKSNSVWLAGSSCDSDDEYVPSKTQDVRMPSFLSEEDLYIAVFDTGAYQDSLASHHCLLSHPAEISLTSRGIRTIAHKETFEETGKQFGW